MFDATVGRAAATTKIEDLSNTFASDLDDYLNDPTIDRSAKEAIMEKLAAIVASRDTAKSFAAGTYSQGTSGSPKALGSGAPAGMTAQDAWKVIFAEPTFTDGMKKAAIRIFTPGDPAQIRVENDGTPTEVKAQNKTITDLTTEKNGLERERDDLKRDLAAEKARTAPANLVDKSVVATALTEAKKKVEAIPEGIHRPGAPSKKADALAELKVVADLVK